MTREEQLQRFADDHNALLNRYSKEYDLSGLEVVGVLECTKARIIANILADPPKAPEKPS